MFHNSIPDLVKLSVGTFSAHVRKLFERMKNLVSVRLVFVVVVGGTVTCNSEILMMPNVFYIRINSLFKKLDHLVHNVKFLVSNKMCVVDSSLRIRKLK